MTIQRRLAAAVSVGVLLLCLIVASSVGAAPKKTIGYLMFDRLDIFCKTIELGMRDYIAQNELNYELLVLDGAGSPSKQTDQMDDLIQRKADVIILQATNPDTLIPAVIAANKAGIPVITVDGPVNGGDFVTFIGGDNYKGGCLAGEFAAQHINEKLNGEANIVILEIAQSQVVCGARVRGFKDTLAKAAPKAKIVAQQDAANSRDKAMNVMDNLLQAHPRIDVVFGDNDKHVLGAIAAAEAAGREKDMLFIGFNADKEAVDLILKGTTFEATVAQYPFLLGTESIRVAQLVLEGEAGGIGKEMLVSPKLITRDNAEEHLKSIKYE